MVSFVMFEGSNLIRSGCVGWVQDGVGVFWMFYGGWFWCLESFVLLIDCVMDGYVNE